MGRTLGIHWIATTYGTWLHGDPRGAWRDGKLIGPDPFLESTVRQRMRGDAVMLSSYERGLVADAFGTVVRCGGHRVYTAAIRPTHVHLVMAALRADVVRAVAALKREASKAVLAHRRTAKETNRSALPPRVWTAGRFIVFMDDARHVEHAIAYVRRHNERAGLPADPYTWLCPWPG